MKSPQPIQRKHLRLWSFLSYLYSKYKRIISTARIQRSKKLFIKTLNPCLLRPGHVLSRLRMH